MAKIAVMGAGGVGGYFGARLADAGNDVAFVARGAHRKAMEKNGLRVQSQLGDIHLNNVTVAESTADLVPVDYIIFAVKMVDTQVAAAACKELLGPETTLITFQNGIQSASQVGAVVGMDHVVPGAAYIASVISEPGVIKHTGKAAKIVFGEINGGTSNRLQRIHELCEAAGIHHEISANVNKAIWSKFALLAPFAGLSTLTRQRAHELRSNSDTLSLFTAAAQEIIDLSKAMSTGLDDSDLDQVLGNFHKMPEDMTSSMYHDLMAGKPLELNGLSGAVAELGRQHNVPTPTHTFIAKALSGYATGTDGR
ncbi:MAG: ketopantoate reductase family protein [Methyloligellaceae bacterium]